MPEFTKNPNFTALPGHTTPDTAIVVEDYPYGFRLRCKIRYWLENHPRHGFRLVSQTSNPKIAGNPWNKPKASIYTKILAVLVRDESTGHIDWDLVNEYSMHDGGLEAFIEAYGFTFDETQQAAAKKWLDGLNAYRILKARREGVVG